MENGLGSADFLQPQRKLRRMPLLGVVMALFVFWFVSRPLAAPPGWVEDFDAAVKQASLANKNLVVAFHSDGCPPCVAMERTVLRADVVQKALTNFVAVKVNVTRQREIAERFAVMATPTYVVINAEGKEIVRTDGYQEEEDMLRFLRSAKVPAPSVNPSSGP